MTARVVGKVRLDDRSFLFLEHENLTGHDFCRPRLQSFSAHACTFRNCKFDGMVVDTVCFGSGKVDSYYLDCTFDDVRFGSVAGGIARFERRSFRDVDIAEFFGFAVELVDCEFSGILRKGFFNGTVSGVYADFLRRKRNEFRGNDFRGARLGDFDFRTGIDPAQQALPDGWTNPS